MRERAEQGDAHQPVQDQKRCDHQYLTPGSDVARRSLLPSEFSKSSGQRQSGVFIGDTMVVNDIENAAAAEAGAGSAFGCTVRTKTA
jgi:hypothetical protein